MSDPVDTEDVFNISTVPMYIPDFEAEVTGDEYFRKNLISGNNKENKDNEVLEIEVTKTSHEIQTEPESEVKAVSVPVSETPVVPPSQFVDPVEELSENIARSAMFGEQRKYQRRSQLQYEQQIKEKAAREASSAASVEDKSTSVKAAATARSRYAVTRTEGPVLRPRSQSNGRTERGRTPSVENRSGPIRPTGAIRAPSVERTRAPSVPRHNAAPISRPDSRPLSRASSVSRDRAPSVTRIREPSIPRVPSRAPSVTRDTRRAPSVERNTAGVRVPLSADRNSSASTRKDSSRIAATGTTRPAIGSTATHRITTSDQKAKTTVTAPTLVNRSRDPVRRGAGPMKIPVSAKRPIATVTRPSPNMRPLERPSQPRSSVIASGTPKRPGFQSNLRKYPIPSDVPEATANRARRSGSQPPQLKNAAQPVKAPGSVRRDIVVKDVVSRLYQPQRRSWATVDTGTAASVPLRSAGTRTGATPTNRSVIRTQNVPTKAVATPTKIQASFGVTANKGKATPSRSVATPIQRSRPTVPIGRTHGLHTPSGTAASIRARSGSVSDRKNVAGSSEKTAEVAKTLAVE